MTDSQFFVVQKKQYLDPAKPGFHSGCYQLFFKLDQAVTCRVGALGNLNLPAGDHVYTGSHQRSLLKRIERHLSRHKKTYWHIDYITLCPHFRLYQIILFPGQDRECEINQSFQSFTHSIVRYPGLGSGDCRMNCGSHFLYHPDLSPSLVDKWIVQAGDYRPIILPAKKAIYKKDE